MPMNRFHLGLSGFHFGEGIGRLKQRAKELDENSKVLLQQRRQLSINISAYSNEVSKLLKGAITAEVNNDIVSQ